MAATAVMESIAMMIMSFLAGFIFFYFMSSQEKTVKKQQISVLISLLIDFVIYIWVGKIIVHMDIFFTDPIAVLAIPGNSQAFYLAVLFILIHIFFQTKRGQLEPLKVMEVFFYTFFSASFVYEFLQLTWNDDTYTWPYLSLLFVLLSGMVALHDRMRSMRLMPIIVFIWSMGQFLFAINRPFTTVFGYSMDWWFFLMIAMATLIAEVINRKERVKS
ncbi:hypothetical protein GWK91_15730 [Virgibacillus sp. MSP4-1]|uniref:hypothetical protein n=1 Tax=Virgibacillus sp. MSP4-1 TaxID=2700081 RepID=UPI0003A57D3B|nr:hypothetical protein [Virgibacillus sp. MSP4-1]QHS24255.1 hypothetical protein GWK91_15730 [Virgibacillus sp. MSP4-1]